MEPVLKLVAPPPISLDRDASQRANTLWGENEQLKQKWLASVYYLRYRSKGGWIIDKRVTKKAN